MPITALIAGAAIIVGFATGWTANGWRLNARIDAIQASYAKAYAEAQEQARAREQALVKQSEDIRRTKDAQIKTINTRLASALSSLRNRPERQASGVPNDTASCTASTGAELARGDAEFLAGYAADAARLQSAYQACLGAYDAARKTLE